MSTCSEVGSGRACPHRGARHQTGRAQAGDTLQRVPISGERDGSSTSSAAILFCFTAGTFIPHASPSLQTGAALASTRQLRSQGPMSVHAHHTEGVTGSEGQEGANGVEGSIGVGGRNGDGNEAGGRNGDVNGHGDWDEAGAGTGVEANEGAQDGNGDGSGDGAGTGMGTEVETRRRTQDGNGDGDGCGDP